MKAALLLSLFCASCIHPSLSWIPLEKANRTNIKKYERHCLGTIYGLGAMDQGEVRRISNTCMLATCLENRNIKFSGCPLLGLSDAVNCRVYPGDLDKDYPDCCYEIQCLDNSEENFPTEKTLYDGFVNATAVDIKRKEKDTE